MQTMLPKSFVDAVGRAHDLASNRAPRNYEKPISDDVIDACEGAHTAAKPTKQKSPKKDIYDDTGLMAYVCRHDIPIFTCNIDTPGEQQKYALSLIIAVMLHLPATATLAVLYDIGCVTSRILKAVRNVFY
jgi:hypothetical protein